MPTDEELQRIERWLDEEKIPFNKMDDDKTLVHLLVTVHNMKINVVTPKAAPEMIIVGGRMNLSDDDRKRLSSMDARGQEEFRSLLSMGLIQMQVFTSPIKMPLEFVICETKAYYEGLSKTVFIDKIYAINRALIFTAFVVSRLSKSMGDVGGFQYPETQPAGYI